MIHEPVARVVGHDVLRLVHVVNQRRQRPQQKGKHTKAKNSNVRSARRHGVFERVANAQVAVDSDSHHDERGERNVARDEELVQLADEIVNHQAVKSDVHDGERNDENARDEVCSGQSQDENRRRHLVHFVAKHVKHKSVPESSEYGKYRQDSDDGRNCCFGNIRLDGGRRSVVRVVSSRVQHG